MKMPPIKPKFFIFKQLIGSNRKHLVSKNIYVISSLNTLAIAWKPISALHPQFVYLPINQESHIMLKIK